MAKTKMGTVDKALSLLRFFDVDHAEFGLSELARLSEFDKTTTLRCLTALERNGFVEQDAESRKYRIGLAPLNLAQIREQTFPVQSLILRELQQIADAVGETSHGTLLMSGEAVTTGICEPDRALYVHIAPSLKLPWHATASGVAITAHLDPEERTKMLAAHGMVSFTESTPTRPEQMEDVWDQCRKSGVVSVTNTYEEDVIGTASPLFGPSGKPVGAVGVAAVAHRMTPELQAQICTEVKRAAHAVTADLGGRTP